jgi:hypothetical protein
MTSPLGNAQNAQIENLLLLHHATWNELARSLMLWDEMNESIRRLERKYSKGDHDNLSMKIRNLEIRMEKYDELIASAKAGK